ncbi:MAG: Asp23/Gls24 family envelope stress response protein [Lachnospiraceae bacterium]|nr:Asp23/Gls24 family envelope stress response protein [Lachnospiraceae bacterium]
MEKELGRSTYVLQDEEGKGRVQIADDVVAVIAGMAATEVKGVSAMAGNITNEIMAKAGRKNLSKGVKISVNKNKVKISLAIMMEYGYNIPGTCSKVQDKVKTAVESMTGLIVTDIDIRISGVDMQKDKRS